MSELDPEKIRQLLSRRAALGVGGVAALAGLGLADFVGAPPASATVVWNHPFTFRGNITSGYGERDDPTHPGQTKMHNGLDYSGPPSSGTAIYAVATGTVAEVDYNGDGFGNYVRINHADSFNSLYGHMLSESSLEIGQIVQAGTLVGYVGSTGSSTGAHLHIEISVNSTRKNPYSYIHNAPLAIPVEDTVVRKVNVTTRFAKLAPGATTAGSGGAGTICALAGDAGYPCAANWQEYTRANVGTSLDRAAAEFRIHGEPIWVAHDQWEALRLSYTQPTPQTVSLSADDRALLTNIATLLSS